jgi:carboxymethylenebutenolidase
MTDASRIAEYPVHPHRPASHARSLLAGIGGATQAKTSRVSGERPVNSRLPYPGSLRLTLLVRFNSSHIVRTRFHPNFMVIKDNEFIDIPTPAGPMRTYVLYPVAEGRYPGIVLFSEIFQVTGPIRRSAAVLAGHGFVVVIPEIFHELEEPGTVLPYNADKINKELSSYDADAKAALSYLKSHPKCTGKIGSMGFCIGGHLAFRSATNPEVLAAACCYPTDIHKRSLGKDLNDDTLDRIPEIKGELLVVFGRQDPHVPCEGRTTIYNALADAGTNFTWHEFNAAHAFMRDEGARYDAAAARMVYAMALDLFHRKLSEGDLAQIQGSAETRH